MTFLKNIIFRFIIWSFIIVCLTLSSAYSKNNQKSNHKNKSERSSKSNSASKNNRKAKSSNLQTEVMPTEQVIEKEPDLKIAVFAGGCFWGVEDLMRREVGVIRTEVGYTGGSIKYPTYELVKTGLTGHAEAVKITYDANKTSYGNLVRFFFAIHNPTQLDRQENDVGNQYRSEIFYANEDQKQIAQKIIENAKISGTFKGAIVTKLSKLQEFFTAEEYHQHYLQKNPDGYTCHYVRKNLNL